MLYLTVFGGLLLYFDDMGKKKAHIEECLNLYSLLCFNVDNNQFTY